MAYSEEDVIKIPRDTWVLLAEDDMRFQVYVKAVFDLWAYEGFSMPEFTPEIDTPARLINNKENNYESYVDWQFQKKDGRNLYVYSVGSPTHILKNI